MRMNLMRVLIMAAIMCMLSACSRDGQESFMDLSPAVDLSDIVRLYKQHIGEDDFNVVEGVYLKDALKSEIDFFHAEDSVRPILLFEGNDFCVDLPDYANSTNECLAKAANLYNYTSLLNNLWSNFDVSLRGCLRDDVDVLESVKSIDEGVLTDESLRKSIGEYKADILKFVSQSINDELVDYDSVWTLRNGVEKALNDYAFHYYEEKDREKFALMLDSVSAANDSLCQVEIRYYSRLSKEEKLGYMLTALSKCNSFKKQCSLLVNWARTKGASAYVDWIIVVASRLMKSGHYSPYLKDLWVIWRALFQSTYGGMSRDSEIPNDIYNEYRKLCFLACLKRIEAHPEDVVAMNCSYCISGRRNIDRCGEFMFGNDVMLEIMNELPDLSGDD